MSMQMQMQDRPTDDEDVEAASIAPMENMDVTDGTLRRKGAVRTFPWLLREAELNLVVPLPLPEALPLPVQGPVPVPVPVPSIEAEAPLQDEEEEAVEDHFIPSVAKRPRLRLRLESSLSTDVAVEDDDATMVDVPADDTVASAVAVAVAVTPPITDDDTVATQSPPAPALAAAAEAASSTLPNKAAAATAGAETKAKAKAKRPPWVTLVCNKWTTEEDVQLTEAVKIFGTTAWVKVAQRIVFRTNNQCRKRWVDNLGLALTSTTTGTGGDTTTRQQQQQQSAGKWTATEDAHLATAVKQFGNEWRAVATLVPGRTNIQCRQRWGRGLLDLENGGTGTGTGTGSAGGEQVKARKWTPQEDIKLADAAAQFGNEWTKVADLVPGRTNAQCRQRWVNRVNPANGTKCRKWSKTEDSMLACAVGDFGNDWTAVASQIEDRTNIQCRQRWLHSLDRAGPGVKTGKWTKEEDAKLLQGVTKFGNNWAAVAAAVVGRTNGQCCQRWLHSSANPDSGEKSRRWTPVEDAKLLKAMKKFGNDWTAIAALVPDRTNAQCGKRWARVFDPANSDKGPWTPAEDATLTEAMTKLGTTNDWSAVAALVPRRGNLQCRQRWLCSLLPAQAEWTSEEDIKLIEAVGECGDDWTAVAALVPDRTDEECGKRWARAFGSNNGDEETLDTRNGDEETLDTGNGDKETLDTGNGDKGGSGIVADTGRKRRAWGCGPEVRQRLDKSCAAHRQ
jgi:hypothetical protein